MVRIGINIVSLMHLGGQWAKFPGCFFARPTKLIEMALDLGYDGVQALPIRGLTGEEEGIILSENVWNSVPSFWHAFRHKPGESGAPSNITDWVVSPPPQIYHQVSERLERRGIPKIVHRFDDNPAHLVEVHPGLDMTPDQIVEQCKGTGQGLVLDTWHLRRKPERHELAHRPKGWDEEMESLLGDWKEAISLLLPQTRVVHVSPRRDDNGEELRRFLDNKSTVIGIMLHHIRNRGFDGDYVVEAHPGFLASLNPWKLRRIMRQFRERLEEIVS